MSERAIAVTGMGAVTALGHGADSLWAGLLDGRRPFAPVRSFDASACRANIAAEVVVPLQTLCSSRAASFGVMTAREALEQARPLPERDRIGLVVGTTAAGDRVLERALASNDTLSQWWRQCLKGTLADDIGSSLNLGPSRQVINTACSSGAIAVALACDGLRAGDFDMALAVGCDELTSTAYAGFNALRALDPDPCRPFDRNRRGMTIGEGAGCLVLERLSDARKQKKHIYAVVAGIGLACDAFHLTAPDPEGRGAALAFERALNDAGISPKDVGFVNAHGTGTPLNDAAEIAGIERALGKYAVDCAVHSVKASTGHCMGAAGTIESIVTILSLGHGVVPATAALVDCEFDGRVACVRANPRSVASGFGVSNSFGFGGNDATLVFAQGNTQA
jgi:3-oxoacyl-[acyl-carrier-protein] synthase II